MTPSEQGLGDETQRHPSLVSHEALKRSVRIPRVPFGRAAPYLTIDSTLKGDTPSFGCDDSQVLRKWAGCGGSAIFLPAMVTRLRPAHVGHARERTALDTVS